MLKSILTFGLTLTIGGVLSIAAQTGKDVRAKGLLARSSHVKPSFTSDQISTDGTTTTFIDHVNVKTKDFEVKDASRVFYDPKKKKITVFGCRDFSGVGQVFVHNIDSLENKIEYVFRSRTINVF